MNKYTWHKLKKGDKIRIAGFRTCKLSCESREYCEQPVTVYGFERELILFNLPGGPNSGCYTSYKYAEVVNE